jgi:hypothetical protein
LNCTNCLPEATSHNTAALPPATTAYRPSGENAMDVTDSECPNCTINRA